MPLRPRAGAQPVAQPLQDGSYEFDGRRHQLAIDQLDKHNAIHGLVRWADGRPWSAKQNRVVMDTCSTPARLPVHARTAHRVQLSAEGLRCANGHERRVESLPLRERGASVSDRRDGAVDVGRSSAARRARAAARTSAASRPALHPSTAPNYDFRRPRPIGATMLDHCFTDLERDGRPCSRRALGTATAERATFWVDEAYPYLMLFTGDPLPDVAGVASRSSP